MGTPSTTDDADDCGGMEAPSSTSTAYTAYVDYLKATPPLSREQQLALHEMMNDAEEPPESRAWAKARLWLDASKFVLYVRNKMARSMPFVRLDDMDAIQNANLAAGLALERWSPKVGTLTTWLWPHVRGALLDYAKSEGSQAVSAETLDADALEDVGEGLEPMSLRDLLVYEHHVFDDPETITEYGQVRKLLIEQNCQRSEDHDGCAPGWGDLAADFLIGDTNVRELAAKYGVSVPTVYNRMRKMGF